MQNDGPMDGTDVVQVYIRDMEASISRRIKELKSFKKVFIKAFDVKTVDILLDIDAFSIWNRDMEYAVEKGNFEIYLGKSSSEYITQTFAVRS